MPYALKKQHPRRRQPGVALHRERAKKERGLQESGIVIPLSEWLGHNDGPPLFQATAYLAWRWRKVRAEAWAPPPIDTVRRRCRRAAELGLSYEQYTLEILERGRYL